MANRRPGAVVGQGNTSEIFEWGHGAVVKVLRPGIPVEWAETEARISGLVHAAGLPTPEVLGTVVVDGRPGVVFERVEGRSLWELMLTAPAAVPHLIDVLTDLQADLTSTAAPAGMPSLHRRLASDIGAAAGLSADERDAALGVLARLPEGSALCHFDLHPDNVVMTGAGPMIVDWFDACAGDVTADVVRSSVLMAPASSVARVPPGRAPLLAQVHDRYLAVATARLPLRGDLLSGWYRVVLAGRLAEPLPAAVTASTLGVFRELVALTHE